MARGRLKVLTCSPELGFGGSESRILNIAKTLDSDTFDHTVATLYTRDPAMEASYGTLHPEFKDAGIRVLDLGPTTATQPTATSSSPNDRHGHHTR